LLVARILYHSEPIIARDELGTRNLFYSTKGDGNDLAPAMRAAGEVGGVRLVASMTLDTHVYSTSRPKAAVRLRVGLKGEGSRDDHRGVDKCEHHL